MEIYTRWDEKLKRQANNELPENRYDSPMKKKDKLSSPTVRKSDLNSDIGFLIISPKEKHRNNNEVVVTNRGVVTSYNQTENEMTHQMIKSKSIEMETPQGFYANDAIDPGDRRTTEVIGDASETSHTSE